MWRTSCLSTSCASQASRLPFLLRLRLLPSCTFPPKRCICNNARQSRSGDNGNLAARNWQHCRVFLFIFGERKCNRAKGSKLTIYIYIYIYIAISRLGSCSNLTKKMFAIDMRSISHQLDYFSSWLQGGNYVEVWKKSPTGCLTGTTSAPLFSRPETQVTAHRAVILRI